MPRSDAPNKRRFLSCCDFTPLLPLTSKRGDAELRYGLYQAAQIASYHNDAFRRIYNRMLEGRQEERGIRTKARVKIAAKMLVIVWPMLKKNEPFNPGYLLAEPM
ncbi:putative transposase family protein [Desulfosarcina variabilis str. Montpellier]|uniref:hypothetical protein n=1 Tax=Desulfosarcina variabilis TaxID=2300 RepID=UPI003AFA54C2